MDATIDLKRYDRHAPTFRSLIGVSDSLGSSKCSGGAVDDYAIRRILVSDAQSKLTMPRPERSDEPQHVSISLHATEAPQGIEEPAATHRTRSSRERERGDRPALRRMSRGQ